LGILFHLCAFITIKRPKNSKLNGIIDTFYRRKSRDATFSRKNEGPEEAGGIGQLQNKSARDRLRKEWIAGTPRTSRSS